MKGFVAPSILALAAQVAAQSNYTVQCYDGLAVLVNRASTEDLGFGVLKTVKDQILSAVPNSGAWFNPYPATLTNYASSEGLGVGNLTQVLKAYVDACPCHKVALLGFSQVCPILLPCSLFRLPFTDCDTQGAQVISDTLLGPSFPAFSVFGYGTGVGSKYVDAISSAALFGDPSFIANLTVDAGNSTTNGIFQRNNSAEWTSYGLDGRVQSFCQAGDFYCSSGTGNDSHDIHDYETFTYGDQAAQFIIQTWNNGTKNTCSSSSSGSSSNGTSTTGSNSTATTGTPKATSSVATSTTNDAVRTGMSGALVLSLIAAAFCSL